jgi:hypothetical protein
MLQGVSIQTLSLPPIGVRTANEFVREHHRHNGKVGFGPRYAIAVVDESGELWGVAIVSHPVSRMLNNHGYTAEVRRVCTKPNAPKGCCSMLYSACWRTWKAMGGTRMVTYTLQTEFGTSLRAAGWKLVAKSRGHLVGQSWDTHPTRTTVAGTVTPQNKWRWEISTDPTLVTKKSGSTNITARRVGKRAATNMSAEAREGESAERGCSSLEN